MKFRDLPEALPYWLSTISYPTHKCGITAKYATCDFVRIDEMHGGKQINTLGVLEFK